MKTKIFIISLLVSSSCFASSKFTDFLKSCGYGALAGAGVGVLSLAIENKPSEHYANVTRGASLGLYAGVAYGIYEMTKAPEYNYHQDYDYSSQIIIMPKLEQARIDGIEVGSTILNF
jgi:hypothetical protein